MGGKAIVQGPKCSWRHARLYRSGSNFFGRRGYRSGFGVDCHEQVPRQPPRWCICTTLRLPGEFFTALPSRACRLCHGNSSANIPLYTEAQQPERRFDNGYASFHPPRQSPYNSHTMHTDIPSGQAYSWYYRLLIIYNRHTLRHQSKDCPVTSSGGYLPFIKRVLEYYIVKCALVLLHHHCMPIV